jgi:hypothetical protein
MRTRKKRFFVLLRKKGERSYVTNLTKADFGSSIYKQTLGGVALMERYYH